MTAAAPGGALREGRVRPGPPLPAITPVLRVVAPVQAPAPSCPLDDAPAPGPAVSRRGRRAVPLLAGAAVAAVAWALLASPFATVRGVEVTGASPRWAAAVREAAAPALGRPLLFAGGAEVAERVGAVPGVRSVSVGVRWPGTLTVAVVERPAAVAVPVRGGVRVFAADGVDLGFEPRPPAGLPRLTVPAGALGPRTVLAAEQAWSGLPRGLAAEVVQAGATSPDGVWFALRDGARVVWGSSGDSVAKADALAALRRTAPSNSGTTFDVSAPDAPSVSTP
jgi:cell division protein FtsQ